MRSARRTSSRFTRFAALVSLVGGLMVACASQTEYDAIEQSEQNWDVSGLPEIRSGEAQSFTLRTTATTFRFQVEAGDVVTLSLRGKSLFVAPATLTLQVRAAPSGSQAGGQTANLERVGDSAVVTWTGTFRRAGTFAALSRAPAGLGPGKAVGYGWLEMTIEHHPELAELDAGVSPDASGETECRGDYASCTRNEQCCSQRCKIDEQRCVPFTPSLPGASCSSSRQCIWSYCVDGTCVSVTPGKGTSCHHHFDCATGFHCQDGLCWPGSPTTKDCVQLHHGGCSVSSPCCEGYCVDGRCRY
ncbi:MAG TPA: hypothetical protein VM925_13850 [Labilithrix sp.]|nr:hypothetical protein [Labilithrix sp.]